MNSFRVLTLIGGSLLIALGRASAADLAYTLQPVAQIGGTVGGFTLPGGVGFAIAGLNDQGRLVFDVGTGDGSKPDLLAQFAAGGVTPILQAGASGPVGPWPSDVFLYGPGPESLNEQGHVVFAVHSRKGSPLGVFRWSAATGESVPLVRKGMSAGPGLTFQDPVEVFPAINNRGEIALGAPVTQTGGASGTGLFLIDAQGQIQPLWLPGQALPDGTRLRLSEPDPSINDEGQIAFLARRTGEKQDSAYLWDHGTVTPLLTVGTVIAGAGTISSASRVLLERRENSALVAAGVDGSPRQGLYRIAGGQVTAIMTPGQPVLDDGKLQNLQNAFVESTQIRTYAISRASTSGQRVIVTILVGGATADYLLDADGKLSRILKSGMMTDRGAITPDETSPGAVNGQGQVALVLSLNGGPDTLFLLTPTLPQPPE
jgi:hypothetical protein